MTENVSQSYSKGIKTGIFVLIVVAIIIAGGLWYTISGTDENTNNSNSTNTVANENTNTNDDTNTVNTNAETNSNTNTSANTNSSVDTSDWLTYTNEEYGFSFKYPSTWNFEYIFETENDRGIATPIMCSKLTSPDEQYLILIGIKGSDDPGTLCYRTGIGAGDIIEDGIIEIGMVSVESWARVFENNVYEIFLYPLSDERYIKIDNHDISVSFGDAYGNSGDLKESQYFEIILSIINSINLSIS